MVSSAAQHCRSQSSRKPGYAVLEELSKHGAFVRAPRTLSPSELTSLLDDLAWMRMPLTPRAGRALRARVAEVAADLLPHEVARCIIAISELQRALREDHRHWSKVKRRRVVRVRICTLCVMVPCNELRFGIKCGRGMGGNLCTLSLPLPFL